jgi:ABC-type bacteriocin/lantibiotic exporter with double-glycine peptidase domain
MGFLKSDGGEILVDGQKIENGRSLRTLMGYVPQSPYILDGTLAENVAFGTGPNQIDRKKIMDLMDDLGLIDLVNQSSNGLDEQIGERGIKLSGGQRQRLAIARALYADASILVLDEVTNQVNPAIELEIMELLDELVKKGKTVVMVTHKIAHPDFFDSIYMLAGGKLQRQVIHA